MFWSRGGGTSSRLLHSPPAGQYTVSRGRGSRPAFRRALSSRRNAALLPTCPRMRPRPPPGPPAPPLLLAWPLPGRVRAPEPSSPPCAWAPGLPGKPGAFGQSAPTPRAPARGSWRTYPPTAVCAAPGSALRSAPSQVLHALSLPSSPRPGTSTAAASSRCPGVPVKPILSTLAGPSCTPTSSPGTRRSERNTKRPVLP